MNSSPFKTITGVTLAGLVVLFATYGNAFFAAMENAYDFLLLISAKAPLGLGSFVLALFGSMLLWLALQKWTKEVRNRWTRSWLIDVYTVMAGVGVAWVQYPTKLGFLFGIMAGLGAPIPARAGMAFATWVGHKFEDKVEAQVAAQLPPKEGA